MSRTKGYYRAPTVCGDRLVFVCEGDLWEAPLRGGRATRLTAAQGEISSPVCSPDGSLLACAAREEGSSEVYVMDALGGVMRRLTFDDHDVLVIGFDAAGGAVRFASSRHAAHQRQSWLFEIDLQGGQPRSLGVGEGAWYAEEDAGAVEQSRRRAVGRHGSDLARWKRYRGGMAGEIWLDLDGSGRWRRLLPEERAGLVRPIWAGGRLYFLSDRDGTANLYSALADGSDLTQHTAHEGFYVRDTQSDGRTIVYSLGGEIYAFDLKLERSVKVPIEVRSPGTELRRRFVEAADYAEHYALHPDGRALHVTARGKPYTFGLWEGGVTQLGERHGARYRLGRYLPCGERLVMTSDAGRAISQERLEVHALSGGEGVGARVEALEELELGRIVALEVSPVGDKVAVGNHRHELWIVELDERRASLVERGEYGHLEQFAWSPDGAWLAYIRELAGETSQLMLHEVERQRNIALTQGEFLESAPCFDPEGRYLYFVTYRTFNPIYGSLFQELGLIRGERLALITLSSKTPSPFVRVARPFEPGEEADEGGDERRDTDSSSFDDELIEEKDESLELVIDMDGIQDRLVLFPFKESTIVQLGATSKRVFMVTEAPRSSLEEEDEEEQSAPGALDLISHGVLRAWSWEESKLKTLAREVSSFELSANGKSLAYWSSGELRVVSSSSTELEEEDDEGDEDDAYTRARGWIDLSRLRLEVDPRREWPQMFAEAWRLMRDEFWQEEMNGADWPEVYRRYAPLVERVATRGELSDVIWAMQGELGTSHAYEFGGDYRPGPAYLVGKLGVELLWDPDAQGAPHSSEPAGAYRIAAILRGDDWSERARSPCRGPGLDVREGDAIWAIDGERVTRARGVEALLLDKVEREVELTLHAAGERAPRRVTVRTIASERELRYRQWVRQRRELAREQSRGRVGYVHVPDMGARGYAEFLRAYAAEREREALIVDVRFNAGGHVSALILERLARARLGLEVPRYGRPVSYPMHGPRGPMVALTNEYTGSDGDIFSHGFKARGLGPLLGRRTWGGVVGIWPRHALVDGSVTTQPAYGFWLEDLGFGLENHGAEPDEEVLDPPRAQADGEDPQLEAAVERALDLLKEQSELLK